MAGVSLAAAQNYRTLPQGTTIKVRTDNAIPAKPALGSAYAATVSEDVVDSNGTLVIPRGSPAQLIAEANGKDDVALDLTNVMIDGQNYNLLATKSGVSNLPGGIGANTRTAKYVGGGAVIGTILGAIFGGGKGAAIGALAGAAAGTGAQVYTGRNQTIPAETVLTYKTAQDLSMQPGRPYNGGLQQRPPQR
jgi:hypothetical protein